jgi:Zn-dependent protease with chaperone function
MQTFARIGMTWPSWSLPVEGFIGPLIRFAPFGWLLAGLVITLVLRSKALRRCTEDYTNVWHRFRRSQTSMWTSLWLGWLVLIPLCGTNTPVFDALRSLPGALLVPAEVVFYVLPPALAVSGCWWLSYPVYARVSGPRWTAAELFRQGFWERLSWFAPLVLAATAVGTLVDGDYRPAFLLIIVAWSARRYAAEQWNRATGVDFRAVTTGDLKERAYGLANRAGVVLRTLYVVPTGRWREANAAAAPNQDIWLTDQLLRKFSRREVDTVIAHEIGHLSRQNRDWLNPVPATAELIGALLVGGVLPLIYYPFLVDRHSPDPWRWFPLILAAIWCCYQLNWGLRLRRREFVADSDAMELTQDPEAMIASLAKLARLGGESLDEARWPSPFATHPPMRQRIELIAQKGAVSRQRLGELLETQATDPDLYSLPAEISAEEPLCTSRYKTAHVKREWMLWLGALSLPSTIAACLVAPDAGLQVRWAVALGGASTTLALAALVYWGLGSIGQADLRRCCGERLERGGLWPQEAGGLFVRLAPAPTPRLYEGWSFWDVGFLVLTDGQLVFLGERTRFVVRRDHIAGLWLGQGLPSWPPLPRLCVSWQDNERNTTGSFSVWPAEVRFSWRMRVATAKLADMVQRWHQNSENWPPCPPALGALPGPADWQVSSTPLAEDYNWKGLAMDVLVSGFLGAGIAFLAGLPLTPSLPRSILYVALVAVSVRALFNLPSLHFGWAKRSG